MRRERREMREIGSQSVLDLMAGVLGEDVQGLGTSRGE